jgi:hypothetical protein
MEDLVEHVLKVVAETFDRPKVRAGAGGGNIIGGLRAETPRVFKQPEERFDGLVRRGRPPFDRAPIIATAKEAIHDGVDDSLELFIDRVAGNLELRHIPVPGPTVMRAICAPIYYGAVQFGHE